MVSPPGPGGEKCGHKGNRGARYGDREQVLARRDQRRERLRLLVTYRFISCHLSLIKDDISVDFCVSEYRRDKGETTAEWIVHEYSTCEALEVLR